MSDIAAERRRQEEALRKAKKEKRLAQEKVKKNIQELKAEKEQREQYRKLAKETNSSASASESKQAVPTVSPLASVAKSGDKAAIQVRLESGNVLKKVYPSDALMRQLFQDVSAMRNPDADSNFSLIMNYPKQEFKQTEETLNSTLASVGLAPQASLLVKAGEGGIRQGDGTGREKMQFQKLIRIVQTDGSQHVAKANSEDLDLNTMADNTVVVIESAHPRAGPLQGTDSIAQLMQDFSEVYFGGIAGIEGSEGGAELTAFYKLPEVWVGWLIFVGGVCVEKVETSDQRLRPNAAQSATPFTSGGPRTVRVTVGSSIPIRDAIRKALGVEPVAPSTPTADDNKVSDAPPQTEDVEMETGEYDFYPEDEVNPGTAKLQDNGEVLVRLHFTASPGQGLFWKVAGSNDTTAFEETYTPAAEAGADQVGIDGTFTFHYRLRNPGSYTFTCNYLRPWLAGDAPRKTLQYQVTVTNSPNSLFA